MFVSRKNLAFIHLIPGKLSASIGVFEFFKQGLYFRAAYPAGAIPVQPIAKSIVQRLVLAASNLASQLNLVFIRAECDVFHRSLSSLIHPIDPYLVMALHGYSVHNFS